MIAILSWILLVVAVLDVLFAVVQLFLLTAMGLIVHEMSAPKAWLTVVGPSVLVVVAAIVLLANPMLDMFGVVAVGILFLIVAALQTAAMMSVFDKRREWDEQLAHIRGRVVSAPAPLNTDWSTERP